jgi:hypothetical protein
MIGNLSRTVFFAFLLGAACVSVAANAQSAPEE